MNKQTSMIDLSSYPQLLESIEAKSKEEVRCVCYHCGKAYKERPFICICHSNVFLIDCYIKDNKVYINNKTKYNKVWTLIEGKEI